MKRLAGAGLRIVGLVGTVVVCVLAFGWSHAMVGLFVATALYACAVIVSRADDC